MSATSDTLFSFAGTSLRAHLHLGGADVLCYPCIALQLFLGNLVLIESGHRACSLNILELFNVKVVFCGWRAGRAGTTRDPLPFGAAAMAKCERGA